MRRVFKIEPIRHLRYAIVQQGYLGLPFHRVYFTNGIDSVEKMPNHRFKLPVGIRLNYFAGDNIILRAYYRYYTDSWGLHSHTASLETTVKITPFFSLTPWFMTHPAEKLWFQFGRQQCPSALSTTAYGEIKESIAIK